MIDYLHKKKWTAVLWFTVIVGSIDIVWGLFIEIYWTVIIAAVFVCHAIYRLIVGGLDE